MQAWGMPFNDSPFVFLLCFVWDPVGSSRSRAPTDSRTSTAKPSLSRSTSGSSTFLRQISSGIATLAAAIAEPPPATSSPKLVCGTDLCFQCYPLQTHMHSECRVFLCNPFLCLSYAALRDLCRVPVMLLHGQRQALDRSHPPLVDEALEQPKQAARPLSRTPTRHSAMRIRTWRILAFLQARLQALLVRRPSFRIRTQFSAAVKVLDISALRVFLITDLALF
jgi:hypothetical protein